MTPFTDFPSSLVEELAACLRAIFQQKNDPYCVVEWGDYYVQYYGRAEYENLWFEAVSDYWMERIDKPLSATQKAALAAEDFLPLGVVANNYCRFLPIAGEADFAAAARYGLGLLRDVYGWRGEELQIDCPLRDLERQAKAVAETPPDDTEETPPRCGIAELPCGQILGDAKAIGPFLFIALDHPENAIYQRRVKLGRSGVYVLPMGTMREATDLAGFILPLSACRDDSLEHFPFNQGRIRQRRDN